MHDNEAEDRLLSLEERTKMRKLKILIVDFDEDSSLALSEYLKSEDFEVSTATDGELGLEKCKGEYPDLVIVEPMISKLHGFELCSIISHDFNGRIPVVVLTKFYREEQFKIEAMSAYGASAFLSKPFKGPEILTVVNDLLKEKIIDSEEKNMPDETQNSDDFSEQSLDDIKIETKMTEMTLKDDLDNGLLEPSFRAETVAEKGEKISDTKTQIDKMLEDTLSELGLNLERKSTPKASIPSPDISIGVEAQEARIATEEGTAEKESVEKEAEERIAITDQEEVEQSKADTFLSSKVREVIEEAEEKTDSAKPEKKETIFSAMEAEEKTRISPLALFKNSLTYLKKLPLKFILPLMLVAAVALSASFIFHKPNSSKSASQNKAATIQPVKKSESPEPARTLKDNWDEFKQSSEDAPPQQDSLTEPASEEPKKEETEVKTKVNEVFAADENTLQDPDVERVNLTKDILTEPAQSSPVPLLPQTLQGSASEIGQTAGNTPSEATSEESTAISDLNFMPGEEQLQEEPPASSESPPIEEGDLVPLEDVDIAPEIAKRVDPKYPSLAFERGVEGKVAINVLISESGDVIETALIKGIPGPYGFDEDCTEAVKQWKFIPAFKNGVKVKVWKTISFTFKKS